MRLRALTFLTAAVVAVITACHSAPPPPPPAPRALTATEAAALAWVQSHAADFRSADSVATPAEQAQLVSFVGNARLLGFSELTEGTREFPYIIRRAVIALAGAAKVRGLAIQAPMAEAMEVDRYVRGGAGDPQRLLRTLGSWRWETREMRGLIEALREYNRGRPRADQVGFYGFEIPSAAHAVDVITSLPQTVTGPALSAWLRREYACVAINEGAHFGLEGRAADSSYWNACGPATRAALDSVVALGKRVESGSPAADDVVYAEQMARLVDHYVRTGLRHLKREEFNAEHVLFLADLIGADAKLVLWGGDVEMGRLTLDRTTVQTAVVLGDRLGDKFRTVAFAFGEGTVRARPAGSTRSGGVPGLADVDIRPPLPSSYEDVLNRAPRDGFWLDLRALPSDSAGTWLRGPRRIRLITELYAESAPEAFETSVEFPKNFDGLVFVHRVAPAKQ